jgi:hypothetical protein
LCFKLYHQGNKKITHGRGELFASHTPDTGSIPRICKWH